MEAQTKDRRQRDWCSLPELAVFNIATKICCVADLLAFGGVCKKWREVYVDAKANLLSSLGPRSLLLLGNGGGGDVSFYCLEEGYVYKRSPPLPAKVVDGLRMLGQSQGHLIAVDAATRTIPSILNPLTGSRIDLPGLPGECSFFDYALLTEPPSGSNCRLVLVRKLIPRCYSNPRGRIMACPLEDPKWTWGDYSGPIKDAIACDGWLVLDVDSISLMTVDAEALGTTDGLCYDVSKRAMSGAGFFAISSEGYLMRIKVESDSGMLVAYLYTGFDGEDSVMDPFDWPSDYGMFVSWQRTDLWCTLDRASRSGVGIGISVDDGGTAAPTSPPVHNAIPFARVSGGNDDLWSNHTFHSNTTYLRPADDCTEHCSLRRFLPPLCRLPSLLTRPSAG